MGSERRLAFRAKLVCVCVCACGREEGRDSPHPPILFVFLSSPLFGSACSCSDVDGVFAVQQQFASAAVGLKPVVTASATASRIVPPQTFYANKVTL